MTSGRGPAKPKKWTCLPQGQPRAPTRDLVVDLLRAVGIEYVALNPGATYRGLHDSLVNYGGNRAPELVLE